MAAKMSAAFNSFFYQQQQPQQQQQHQKQEQQHNSMNMDANFLNSKITNGSAFSHEAGVPDLHLKMSKKIAQLTKVSIEIFSVQNRLTHFIFNFFLF